MNGRCLYVHNEAEVIGRERQDLETLVGFFSLFIVNGFRMDVIHSIYVKFGGQEMGKATSVVGKEVFTIVLLSFY